MDLTIYPSKLSGKIEAIPSKSQAHRLMICAAFSDRETVLKCPQTNEDIQATAQCLNALGADIKRTETGYKIKPIGKLPNSALIDCGESGSTLRFLLPVVCALGINTTILMHGRLPYRPLTPLWEELIRMGAVLSKPTENTIKTSGKLHSGDFTINGNISSQFISGLLFATALLPGNSTIHITGLLESKPYVDMTLYALNIFGVNINDYHINSCYPFHSPGNLTVEGDWSNAAFFLAAKALGNAVEVTNLNPYSQQGDRVIERLLTNHESINTICARDIPDLVPILAVTFGAKNGVVFNDIARLRLKESDRVASVCDMLNNFGAKAIAAENTLTVNPGQYRGCTIDAANDHRIAMAAAIAATVANGPVTILGAECVSKSYPNFWNEYKRLGGKYE